MAFALIDDATGTSPDTEIVTSGAIDSTGANLLVSGLGSSWNTKPFFDSKSNTWSQVRSELENFDFDRQASIAWSTPTSVGSGHTGSHGQALSSNYQAIVFAAFSGAAASSPEDQTADDYISSTESIQAGSITPTEANELIIAVLCSRSDVEVSIDSGFTIIAQIPASESPQYRAVAMAYKIQTSAEAVNPTWSWTGAHAAVAIIHSFKAGAGGGGGGGNPWHHYAQMRRAA